MLHFAMYKIFKIYIKFLVLHIIHLEVFMAKKWKPGETVPESANYEAYDKNGNNGGSLYLEKGKRFPATQHEDSYYTLEQ